MEWKSDNLRRLVFPFIQNDHLAVCFVLFFGKILRCCYLLSRAITISLFLIRQKYSNKKINDKKVT